MSRSYHVTRRTFKDCSKRELAEQAKDPNSDLSVWVVKRSVKKEEKTKRKVTGLIGDENEDPTKVLPSGNANADSENPEPLDD